MNGGNNLPQVDILIAETFNSDNKQYRSCCSDPFRDKDSRKNRTAISSNPAPRECIGGRGNSYI
jgi:hypothetical protein